MMISGIALSSGKASHLPHRRFPVRVEADAVSESFAPTADEAIEEENALAKMARLISSNDRLHNEVHSLRVRIDAAKAYLTEPGCRVRLGTAYLDQLENRRSAAIARLRANRIEARILLDSLNY